jgi:hypothetical protein
MLRGNGSLPTHALIGVVIGPRGDSAAQCRCGWLSGFWDGAENYRAEMDHHLELCVLPEAA